jgi:3-methyl-2-oxobutanoate hydroxymethyltransferase
MQGRAKADGDAIIDDAHALKEAGAFAVVLECVDRDLSDRLVAAVDVPVIGIGASAACAGQILVTDDMLGMLDGPSPRFVKHFAALRKNIREAVQAYAKDVKTAAFPGAAHVYEKPAVTLAKPRKTG